MIIRKIMLLGEIGVGKTSIARRLVFDKFGDLYKATIGVDVYRYEVIPSPATSPFHFLVWDTDGSYGEGIMRQFYTQQAQAALVVADVSRPSTVDTMVTLANQFREHSPGRYVAMVLNKLDLVDQKPPHDVMARLTGSNIEVAVTSARDGTNIANTFHQAASEILKLEQ